MRLALHAIAVLLVVTLVGPGALPLYALGVAGWWLWRWCRRQDDDMRRLDDAYWRQRAEYETSTEKGWGDE